KIIMTGLSRFNVRRKGEAGRARPWLRRGRDADPAAVQNQTQTSVPNDLAGHDQIDRLRTFALLVGLDVEADLLPLVQALEARLLHGRDVHEHVASAVVRFHEPVAAFAVEELHSPSLRHRETPPYSRPPPAPRTAARRDFAPEGGIDHLRP